MKSFLLASGNPHKAEEFEALCEGKLKINASPASLEVEENGLSYSQNAFLKAKAYYEKYQSPSMADDSGLTIEELPGILGVESARFEPKLTYPEKCDLLIEKLKGKSNRRAYFTCVLCFYESPQNIYFFEGQLQGEISIERSGSGGFGYDPIFVPLRDENDGKTLAELPDWKNLFSHRAKAVQEALQFYKETIDKTSK